jgi:hypothetical protein
MLFRDGRMVSGQQNPEGDANGKGGEADATLWRKVVRMAGGAAFMLHPPSR